MENTEPKQPTVRQSIFTWFKQYHNVVKFTSIAIISIAIIGYLGVKTYTPVSLVAPKHNVSMKGPFSIQLNQTLSHVDTSKINVIPAIDGQWHYKRGNLINSDSLVFTPKNYFKENTTYKVSLPSANRLLGGLVQLPSLAFTTEKAPGVSKTGIKTWAEGQIIPADSDFKVELESPNHNTRKIELRLTPDIKVKSAIKDDKIYTWTPLELLPQNTDINVELYDTKNNESLLKLTVHTAAEPKLTSPLQRGNIDENDTINLTFADPMLADSTTITFDTPGKGSWQNDATYAFKPDKLTPNTTYSYTISKNARSRAGGILMSDIAGKFTTYGAITVVSTSPKGTNLAQNQQTISFTFNRQVDQNSALERLSISSGNITGTSWKGNTLYATVTNIGFQKSFSATIAPGVINTAFGTPSSQAYSLSFTTEPRSAKLDIPFYRQQHSGTCTAASLRMILAYRGIQSDEVSLVNHMGYNPRPKDTSTDPHTWDDPQQMFVGNIDGSIKDGTAAGPDAPPVAKAARAMGRNASAVTGISASWIAEQLYAGNPVIMFGAFRDTGMTTWQTPTGGTAIMNLTGHATVVTGVVGEPNAPIGFWVNDPLGSASYWTAGAVSANIARDPHRQAVVVY